MYVISKSKWHVCMFPKLCFLYSHLKGFVKWPCFLCWLVVSYCYCSFFFFVNIYLYSIFWRKISIKPYIQKQLRRFWPPPPPLWIFTHWTISITCIIHQLRCITTILQFTDRYSLYMYIRAIVSKILYKYTV